MQKEIPEFLLEKLNHQYGEKQAKKIIEGYKAKRPVTLRVNTIKATVEEVKDELLKEKIDYQEVPWSKEALIIKDIKEEVIQNLEIYQEGKIYLQSLSSMLPPIILDPKENTTILDMTAAPGGKTTQMAAMTNNNAQITACEMNKIRAEKLKFNIERQGATSSYVMEVDSRKLDDYFSFDTILLDAPCSGSGTINLEKVNFETGFTEKLITKSVQSQKQLIKKAWNILKPGGELVYSTCSILQEENEKAVIEILHNKEAEIVPINEDLLKDIPMLKSALQGTVCVCPNKLYEGFYIAKIRKIREQ